MAKNDEMVRLDGSGARSEVNASGLLSKLVTFATGAVLLVVGLMFSLLVFALAATAVVLIFTFLWWKTTEQRRQMRGKPPGGRVIDGEVLRDSVKQEADRTRGTY